MPDKHAETERFSRDLITNIVPLVNQARTVGEWLEVFAVLKVLQLTTKAAALKRENTVLREFFDAQVAFDKEDEDHDYKAWGEAGDRLVAAQNAVEKLHG